MRRTPWILLTAVAATIGLAACATPAPVAEETIAEQPFVELTGPHSVGVRDLFWVSERAEPFTREPDDRRRMLVRVWYPALSTEADAAARYVPDPDEFDGAATFEGVLHVLTRGFAAAAPDVSAGPYPVLVFHPGGGWTRLSDTFWTEQLASHGYVVFAVDHPGFNQSVVFPDGHRFEPDQLAFPEETDDLERSARASWAHLDQHHFPLWLEDHREVLDHVERMAGDPGEPLAPLLDLDRIGAFGWSFGGALSVMASRDDPRVKAAVDGDGQLFGDVAETGTPRPVLLLHSEPDPVPPEQQEVFDRLVADVEANFAALRDNSPLVWEATLRGASHGSFSDLVIATPPPTGRLGAQRGHEIINALSLAFFDRHLKGAEAELLEEMEQVIPELKGVHRP